MNEGGAALCTAPRAQEIPHSRVAEGAVPLPVADRTDAIRPGDILCFSTLRNERPRLSYFLKLLP
jgi:hypothetical protein